MKRIFCDNCEKEFQYSEQSSLTDGKHQQRIHLDKILILVTLNVQPAQSGHDICPECRWRAVTCLDPNVRKIQL